MTGPLSQVHRELGVSNSALSRWEAEDDFAKAEAEKASGVVPILDADEQAELVRLRREVRRLETENEIVTGGNGAGGGSYDRLAQAYEFRTTPQTS